MTNSIPAPAPAPVQSVALFLRQALRGEPLSEAQQDSLIRELRAVSEAGYFAEVGHETVRALGSYLCSEIMARVHILSAGAARRDQP